MKALSAFIERTVTNVTNVNWFRAAASWMFVTWLVWFGATAMYFIVTADSELKPLIWKLLQKEPGKLLSMMAGGASSGIGVLAVLFLPIFVFDEIVLRPRSVLRSTAFFGFCGLVIVFIGGGIGQMAAASSVVVGFVIAGFLYRVLSGAKEPKEKNGRENTDNGRISK
jgi:hypothetical protein